MKKIRIRLRSYVGEEWWSWFGGLTVEHPQEQQTVIHGSLPDMAAVYGLLETIRNLGLEILSVRMESEPGTYELNCSEKPMPEEE